MIFVLELKLHKAERPQVGGSTIGLAGCGIWLILRARFRMRVKNRSRKRDFKYVLERDYAFFKGWDVGIVRYSMQNTRLQSVRDYIFYELTESACV